jgi:hypothetical protein
MRKLILLAFLAGAVQAEEKVLRYVHKHEELKYTFGGAALTHHV